MCIDASLKWLLAKIKNFETVKLFHSRVKQQCEKIAPKRSYIVAGGSSVVKQAAGGVSSSASSVVVKKSCLATGANAPHVV